MKIKIRFAFPFLTSQEGYGTPERSFTPISCSIVFGVAGWTTTMEVVDEYGSISKRILTKHFF
jgi:hypothetical protein